MLSSMILSLALHTAAFAGASGVNFTQDEINADTLHAATIGETASACLQRTWKTHNEFYASHGYSKFYGSRKKDYATAEGRKAALLKILPDLARRVRKGDPAAIAELDRREAELETTSCVGLALKCLGEGFRAAGMSSTWDKIYTWVGREGSDGTPLFYGTDLQKALVDLGWKSLYWNPDVSRNADWDQIDRLLNPLKEYDDKDWNSVWGGHAERWNSVLRSHTYYGIPVHDIQTLVNFGISPGPDFQRVPFFVGTAHAGYHVFPGYQGNVIEAHSVRQLKGRDNMEVGPFNPLSQPQNGIQNGNGAPRWTNSEHYRSGVIVVPPGMLADRPYVTPPPARDTPRDIWPERQEEDPDRDGPQWRGPGWQDDPWRRGPGYWPPQPRRPRPCFWPFCSR